MKNKIFITVNYVGNSIDLLKFKKNNTLILEDNNLYNLSNIIGILPFDKDNFFYISNHITIFKIKNWLINYFLSYNRGFVIILDILGLGFSVSSTNKILRFNLGYNHSIFYNIPRDVIIKVKRKKIYLFGKSFFILKNLVTEFKNFRNLSAYKLKGIKDKNELYIKKNWKKNIV